MSYFIMLLAQLVIPLLAIAQSTNVPYTAKLVVNWLNNHTWFERNYWKLNRVVSASMPDLWDDSLRLTISIVRTECIREEDQSRIQLDLCPVCDNPKQLCEVDFTIDPDGTTHFEHKFCPQIEKISTPANDTNANTSIVADAASSSDEPAHTLADEIDEEEKEADVLDNGSRQSPLDLTQTLLDAVIPVVKPKISTICEQHTLLKYWPSPVEPKLDQKCTWHPLAKNPRGIINTYFSFIFFPLMSPFIYEYGM